MVGAAYLLSIDWVVRDCEFAIWIGERDFQGRGVGTFATYKALEHAFLDLNLNRVYLAVIDNNERAIAVYKKSGFTVEGVQRQAVFKEGAYLDVVQMSILASEFKVLE
ncbi:Spermidine N(1)-acetyltransferase [compost metagenome]